MISNPPPERPNVRPGLSTSDGLPFPDLRLNPDYLDGYRPKPPMKLRTALLTGGSILLFLLFWIARPAINAGGNFVHCLLTDCDPSGPAVSWSVQLAAANAAAHALDKSALLDGVLASPAALPPQAFVDPDPDWAYTTWTYTKTLKVDFFYTGPEGETLIVSLLDTDPTSTAKADRVESSTLNVQGYENDQESKEEIEAELAAMQAGPRDAILRTWQQANAHARELGISIYPNISLNLATSSWHVEYWPGSKLSPLSQGLAYEHLGPFSSVFDIDAKTGEVKKSQNVYLQPTVTPAAP